MAHYSSHDILRCTSEETAVSSFCCTPKHTRHADSNTYFGISLCMSEYMWTKYEENTKTSMPGRTIRIIYYNVSVHAQLSHCCMVCFMCDTRRNQTVSLSLTSSGGAATAVYHLRVRIQSTRNRYSDSSGSSLLLVASLRRGEHTTAVRLQKKITKSFSNTLRTSSILRIRE